nr:MFS transporter [Pasteurella canis]
MAYRKKLPQGEDDLNPSNHWEQPHTIPMWHFDRSPVMIQVEYQINPENQSAFLSKLHQLAEQP